MYGFYLSVEIASRSSKISWGTFLIDKREKERVEFAPTVSEYPSKLSNQNTSCEAKKICVSLHSYKLCIPMHVVRGH